MLLPAHLPPSYFMVIADIGFLRGHPARPNEVRSRQVCQIQRYSCRQQCSRTWPPIWTEVTIWYCYTANVTFWGPAERRTDLEETYRRRTSKRPQFCGDSIQLVEVTSDKSTEGGTSPCTESSTLPLEGSQSVGLSKRVGLQKKTRSSKESLS